MTQRCSVATASNSSAPLHFSINVTVPAIIDSQTVPAADTRAPIRPRLGWRQEKNGVTRHLAVDVNGLLLAVVVTAASIQHRDAAHQLLSRTARQLLHHRVGLGQQRLPRTVAHLGEDVLTLTLQIIRRPPGALVSTSGPAFGRGEKFRVDQQAPPLRARLRDQPDQPKPWSSSP